MTKKSIVVLFSAMLVMSVLVGLLVSSVQGKAETAIGVVNMEAVYTQYMAPPLFAARDEMQKEFNAESENMEAEEKQKLFATYQEKLAELEKEYKANIDEVVTKIGQERGVDIILDASTVLFGGVDLTEDVIAALK